MLTKNEKKQAEEEGLCIYSRSFEQNNFGDRDGDSINFDEKTGRFKIELWSHKISGRSRHQFDFKQDTTEAQEKDLYSKASAINTALDYYHTLEQTKIDLRNEQLADDEAEMDALRAQRKNVNARIAALEDEISEKEIKLFEKYEVEKAGQLEAVYNAVDYIYNSLHADVIKQEKVKADLIKKLQSKKFSKRFLKKKFPTLKNGKHSKRTAELLKKREFLLAAIKPDSNAGFYKYTLPEKVKSNHLAKLLLDYERILFDNYISAIQTNYLTIDGFMRFYPKPFKIVDLNELDMTPDWMITSKLDNTGFKGKLKKMNASQLQSLIDNEKHSFSNYIDLFDGSYRKEHLKIAMSGDAIINAYYYARPERTTDYPSKSAFGQEHVPQFPIIIEKLTGFFYIKNY